MTDIEEKIAKAEKEIRQLQDRKRKLLNQKKDAERKARTHRLIERGTILESLLVQQRADKRLVGNCFSDRTGTGTFTEKRGRKRGELNLPCLTRAHLYYLIKYNGKEEPLSNGAVQLSFMDDSDVVIEDE